MSIYLGNTFPSIAAIALEASSTDANVTKPNPLDLFCSLSTITLAANEIHHCQTVMPAPYHCHTKEERVGTRQVGK